MSRALSEEVIAGRAAISVNDPGTEVPEGWTRVRLTGIARLESGHTPSRRHPEWWGGDIPWVSLPDAREHHGRVINDTTQKTNELGLANSAARWLPKDTVCLSRTASVGYVFRLGRPMATSQDFVNWVCSPALEPRFLMQALLAEGKHLLNFGMGTTHTTIYFPAVLAFHINLAPLPEQRRLVDKVEGLLEQVNRAKGRLDRVPLILKRFRQAVLAAACSGELTQEWRVQHPVAPGRVLKLLSVGATSSDEAPEIELPASWSWVATAELCDPSRAITYGVIKLGDPCRDGVPTLRSSDVRPLFIDETNIKRIAPDIAKQFGRTFLRGGEVVITVRGTLGGIAVVPSRMAGYNISREVAVLPVKPPVVPDFVAFAVANITSQNWLNERAKGVAYTGINIEDLRLLPLPTPPPDEQAEIVRQVQKLFALADTIEGRVKAATARADKLPQAILSKAFSGELVPTEADLARAEGRTYETAEELLRRVTATAAAPSPKTGTKKKSKAS